MNLHVETVALARKFKAEADRLDTIFTQTCDPRALQGGARCEDADTHRSFSRRLFDLAREMESGEATDANLKPTDTSKPFTAGGHLIEVERQIIERLVIDIVAAEAFISVHDGEEFALEKSNDKDAIMAAVGLSDDTRLIVYRAYDEAEAAGWVQLIHGNDADVISDYSLALEILCLGANQLAKKFQ